MMREENQFIKDPSHTSKAEMFPKGRSEYLGKSVKASVLKIAI